MSEILSPVLSPWQLHRWSSAIQKTGVWTWPLTSWLTPLTHRVSPASERRCGAVLTSPSTSHMNCKVSEIRNLISALAHQQRNICFWEVSVHASVCMKQSIPLRNKHLNPCLGLKWIWICSRPVDVILFCFGHTAADPSCVICYDVVLWKYLNSVWAAFLFSDQ